ncbi:MAG: hypothetical protein HFK08_01995 [Clostridia bacterium]|jgi:flavin reductase (DIM6/NTAB) family NADH-FMN oxidoreductase RutF|nr:hypothetical protein [Clostridia bacterium]
MRITEKQQQKLMNTMNTCGLFVTCGTKPHNVMSTHWGVIGTLWNKQVFVLPVRESKLSHEIIESTKSFAVCMPIKDMRDEIVLCDHLSGFKADKFAELRLHPKRARHIDSYVVGDCGYILECKVILSTNMSKANMSDELLKDMYFHKDFHTMYFGEIVDAYEL